MFQMLVLIILLKGLMFGMSVITASKLSALYKTFLHLLGWWQQSCHYKLKQNLIKQRSLGSFLGLKWWFWYISWWTWRWIPGPKQEKCMGTFLHSPKLLSLVLTCTTYLFNSRDGVNGQLLECILQITYWRQQIVNFHYKSVLWLNECSFLTINNF